MKKEYQKLKIDLSYIPVSDIITFSGDPGISLEDGELPIF